VLYKFAITIPAYQFTTQPIPSPHNTHSFIRPYTPELVSLSDLPLFQVELKDVLRNPSPAELLHSVFGPLELVVSVCRDPSGQPKFVESIISPLLAAETVRFLETHLHAEELRLLQSLGQSWTVSRYFAKLAIYATHFYLCG